MDVQVSAANVERDIVLWEHVPSVDMDDFLTDDAAAEKVVVVAMEDRISEASGNTWLVV